jgi:Kef-type K+ transport system membrane component KefB/nucleotide-binding universal stress UspA family protein
MHGLLLLLIQIGVVLVAARVVGYAFRLIKQPQVVGEMVAGIVLGPSLLGWAAPAFSATLFPAESLGVLGTLSQVGLLLFMFLVGLELDPRLLRGRGEAAVVTSHVSIVAPFLLGSVLALFLYPRLSDASVDFVGFALFMGAAMSVTAFPVLARILAERNLLRTKLGAVALACAAVDDVTAWSLLAVVVAIVRADAAQHPLWVTFAGTLGYIAMMFLVVRPLLGRVLRLYESRGRLTQDVLGLVLLGLLASAAATEWLGIHALFGAFLFGTILPREREFVRDLTEKLEDVTVVFFLPLFFASTGLRTSIGLVSGPEMWGFFGLVMLVAVAGKFGGSTLAARLTGLSWRESGALGILMNTRGLMELVILTIGLDLGVISPALFAMMVLMALVTTFMTTPLLEWVYPARLLVGEAEEGEAPDEAPMTVVIPVSLPSSGPALLRVAKALAPADRLRVYGLHLARPEGRPVVDPAVDPAAPVPETQTDSPLAPLLAAARTTDLDVRTLDFISRDPGRDIADVAHQKAADLVLMGWHKPVVSQSILGGTVYDVFRQTRADVAVYLERTFRPWARVLVPYRGGVHDLGALELAGRISQTTGAEVTLLHVIAPEAATPGVGGDGEAAAEPFPDGLVLRVVTSADPVQALVDVAREGYDLVVVGVSDAWGLEPALFSPRHERLARECPASMLIVRRYVAPEPAPRRLRFGRRPAPAAA